MCGRYEGGKQELWEYCHITLCIVGEEVRLIA
jgi:hypothetical protein